MTSMWVSPETTSVRLSISFDVIWTRASISNILFNEVTLPLLFKKIHSVWEIMSKDPANVFLSSFWYNEIVTVVKVNISTVYKSYHAYLILTWHLAVILLPFKHKKNISVGISEWYTPYSYFCVKTSKRCRNSSTIHDERPCEISEEHICFRCLSNDNCEMIFSADELGIVDWKTHCLLSWRTHCFSVASLLLLAHMSKTFETRRLFHGILCGHQWIG